jgi:hypothetical protein
MLPMKKVLLSFLFVSMIAATCSINIFAKEKPFNGFYVDQTIMKTTNKQGEASTVTFHVRNESDRSAHVNVSVKDFEMKNKQLLIKKDVPKSFSVSNWTQAKNPSFKLSGGEAKEVKLNVSVPKDAEMGEHNAIVILQFLPDNGQNGNVKIATQIIPVLYVTVTDQNGYVNLIKKWGLTKFHYVKAKDKSYYFEYDVKNTGNVHLESQGTLEIKNILNKKEKKIKIPKVNLLPHASKTIAAKWKPTDSFGIYEVKSSFSMDGKKFVNKTVKIYQIPWVYVLLLIILVIGIIFIIRYYIKSLKRKMLEEAKRQLSDK